jgi:hypothetical protein
MSTVKRLAAVAVCSLAACGGGNGGSRNEAVDEAVDEIADDACHMIDEGWTRADVIDFVADVIRDTAEDNGVDYSGQPIEIYVDYRLLADC